MFGFMEKSETVPKLHLVVGGVDKFIVKSIILPTNCSIYVTVSIRGIISVHTAPRNKSPRTVAEHQLRLVIKKIRANINTYKD